MKYSKGDRLVVSTLFEQSGNMIQEGWTFTILGHEGSSYLCRFDLRHHRDFHDLDGRCRWGYGYYMNRRKVDAFTSRFMDNPDWEL